MGNHFNPERDLPLLYDASRRMGAALDVESVVAAYLQQVADGEQYACTVTLYEDEQGRPYPDPAARARVHILGAWTPADGLTLTPRYHPYNRDALDDPLDAGEAVTISDVRDDERVTPMLRQIQEDSGRPALALIPLMARGERRMGLVILSASEPQEWACEDFRRYQITATLLAASLDARIQQRLLHERGMRLAVFEERQRLARDLHDSVTQLLFSMTLIAESLPAALRRDVSEGERRAHRLHELSRTALTEMRALLAELRPVPATQDVPSLSIAPKFPLDIEGTGETPEPLETLSDALRRLPERFSGVNGTRILIEAHEDGNIAPSVQAALLRIAGEALANALKHAHAENVHISLSADADVLHLTIADDGIGFDPSAPGRAGSLGMTTMRERAEGLGATLRIISRPGAGATVTVELPMWVMG